MTELREKVARAIRAVKPVKDDGQVSVLDLADAAIRVCREHFAGVAEAENSLDPGVRCLDTATANAIASAIRAEGK